MVIGDPATIVSLFDLLSSTFQGIQPGEILGPDANRITVMLCCDGGSSFSVRLGGLTQAQPNIIVNSGLNPIVLQFSDFGSAIQGSISALLLVPGGTLYVTSVRYIPQRFSVGKAGDA